jgi:transglutaminase-like putative cysteine protease
VIERVRRLSATEAVLAVFAVAGAAAFAWGRADPRAWLVLLAYPPAVVFRITSVPPLLRGVVEKAAWILVGALAVAVFFWLASVQGQGEPTPAVPAAVAYSVPLLCALLLAGRAVWTPGRALIPAVLVTSVLGAARSRTTREMGLAIAVVAFTGLLVLVSDEGHGPTAARLRRLIRLAVFALLATVLALGVSRLLPWAQPHVVQAAARAAFPDATSGFSPDASLGGTEELSLSTEVVLRAWSERPRKLRAWVATRFDGRRWYAVPRPAHGLAGGNWTPPRELRTWFDEIPGQTFLVSPLDSAERIGARAERTRILLVLPVPGAIPAPWGVVALRALAPRLSVDGAQLLGPALPAGALYALASGALDTGEAPGSEALDLPPDTDPRLLALAGRLGAGAATSAERVERTLLYLQTELRYSLRVGRLRSRQPVAEFVFEKRQGWCQYFASAAAVLLRLQGVPTRYVSGFQLRPRLFRGGHYVVRQADAHAWIEVWLPERGWVEADPTPASGYDEAHGGPGDTWLDDAWQWLRGLGGRLQALDWKAVPRLLWTEIAAFAARGTVRILVPVAIAPLAILGAARLARWLRRIRRRRTASPAASDPLALLLARLDRAWSRRGVPRPPSRTPLEHVQQLASDRVPPSLLDVGRELVEVYYRARFAGEPPAPGRVQTLESALRRALRAR